MNQVAETEVTIGGEDGGDDEDNDTSAAAAMMEQQVHDETQTSAVPDQLAELTQVLFHH